MMFTSLISISKNVKWHSTNMFGSERNVSMYSSDLSQIVGNFLKAFLKKYKGSRGESQLFKI